MGAEGYKMNYLFIIFLLGKSGLEKKDFLKNMAKENHGVKFKPVLASIVILFSSCFNFSFLHEEHLCNTIFRKN